MKIRNKLEDIGIDTDEKEMYKLTRFVWLEAQKDLLDKIENHLKEVEILNESLKGLTKHQSYHIGISDCINIIKNRKLKLSNN